MYQEKMFYIAVINRPKVSEHNAFYQNVHMLSFCHGHVELRN